MKMMSYQKLKVMSLILLSKNEEISKKSGFRDFQYKGYLDKKGGEK